MGMWSEDDFFSCDQLQEDTEDSDGIPVSRVYHLILDSKLNIYLAVHIGTSCDKNDNKLPKDMPPPPLDSDSKLPPMGDWTPYNDRKEFETMDLLFTYEQMSAKNIDKLFNIWEASLVKFDPAPPFMNSGDMYKTINLTPYGNTQ